MIGSENKKKGIGMNNLGVDLYIFARFGDKKELGNNTLASAGPKYLGTLSQPLVGVVNINREMDYSKNNSLNYFEGIIIHEFTHILGFSKWYFKNIFHNILFKTDKYGIERAYINSTKVVNVARKYFNCKTLEGVELENQGGEGTSGSHWEARILLGDYMNGVIYTPEQVISEFTLALLEDTGYYKANYYTGGLMQFGKNKGCEFLNSKCINDGKVNSKFSNEFFDNINNDINYLDASCSSGRQSRAYHFLINYGSIPKEYQYFSKSSGGFETADYCPISFRKYEEEKTIYYVGHCSDIGGDNYGINIPYIYSNNKAKYYSSGELKSITGEHHSSNSYCVLSSLISKKISDYKKYSNTLRAVCYQMYCSTSSLTIQINNNYFVCPRARGKIDALDFDGYLLCPDYNLICSGKALCNNMFDCVEKKSELKEVSYDYVSRTSQDYDDIEDENIEEDGYELSNNGKCPINCHQCNQYGECLVCKKMTYLTVKNTCEKCPSGEYSLKGENKCKPCSAGRYLDSLSNQCIQCSAGFYSKAGATSCTKCPAGTYSFQGSASCFKCPAGSYAPVSGSSSCRKCKDGYISLEGSSECYKKCPGGQYPSGDRCYFCSAGTFSKAGSKSCTNCLAGTYSSSGSSSCYKCPAGKHSKAKSSKCDDCPAGTYSPIGSSFCFNCAAGYYSLKGSSKCSICKAGTYSLSGSASCTKCSAGYYSDQEASKCTICSAGTFSPAGSPTCFDCPEGYFSPTSGSSSCKKCPIGYTSIKGSSSCHKKCPAGQYLLNNKCYSCSAGTYSKEGSKYCTNCPAGSYSNSGASSCTQCPAGKYSKEKASICNDCSAGTFSPSGSSSCYNCPAGYYSNNAASQCSICKAGTYSLCGAKICMKCPIGKASKSGSSGCL